jgi:hypothetical protein
MRVQTLQRIVASVAAEIYDWQEETNCHRFDILLGKLEFVIDKLGPLSIDTKLECVGDPCACEGCD